MVGGETKRIAETLEQLRVRLIVGYMRWALSLSRALSLSHSSFCLATKDGFSPFAKGESTPLVASSRLCTNKVTNNNNSTLKLISRTEYAVGGHVA